MVGVWNVDQRMWPGPGAAAVQLPSAVARRRLIGTALEEVMELAAASQDSFTRVAYFNYNTVTKQYEYFSFDTRAPQMMYERSYGDGVRANAVDLRTVTLHLDSFVAEQWGEARNAAFRLRLVIDGGDNRQIVRLHLTPLSGDKADEFLAMEYVYTRKP
jgi:hypothetical protein